MDDEVIDKINALKEWFNDDILIVKEHSIK